MELMLVVYLAGVVEGLSAFFASVSGWAAIMALISIAAMVLVWLNGKEISKKLKTTFTVLCVFSVLSGAAKAVTPSEKTVYMMLGAYSVQTALQSETASKVMRIVNNKLEEYLKEVEK